MGCGSSTQEEGPQNNTRPAAPSPKNIPTPSPPAQEERGGDWVRLSVYLYRPWQGTGKYVI